MTIRNVPEGAIRARSTPAEVAELERLCFGEPWPESALRDILANPAVTAWVLESSSSRPHAYLLFQETGAEAEILRIGTLPEHRGQGAGLRLLRVFQAWCRQRGVGRVFLEVRENNHAARRLYDRGGFTVAGRRKGYYSTPPADALVLQWRSDTPPNA
jgi:ribosomal-protein-alanine N-acetyltransferase